MLSNEMGVIGLQICAVVIASMAVPSVLAYTLFSPNLQSALKERISVCQAPQKAMLHLENGSAISYELHDADDAWTASRYVTACQDSSSYVEGSASVSLKIEDGFNTGMVAYHEIADNIGTLDLNDCDYITFWIKSSADLDDGILQLRLSDRADVASLTEGLAIPGSVLNGRSWQKVSVSLSETDIDYDAVKSIGLHAAADPGVVTIWLDIIETPPAWSTRNPVEFDLNEFVYAPIEGAMLAG